MKKMEKLYRRFFEYIDRNSNYIGDFRNISAQIRIYQRFSRYIDLPTKSDNKSCSERDSFHYKKSVYLDKIKGYIIFLPNK